MGSGVNLSAEELLAIALGDTAGAAGVPRGLAPDLSGVPPQPDSAGGAHLRDREGFRTSPTPFDVNIAERLSSDVGFESTRPEDLANASIRSNRGAGLEAGLTATPPEIIVPAILDALNNAPEEKREPFLNSILSNLPARPTVDLSGIDAAQADLQGVLGKIDSTAPKEPEQLSKDETMLRILFGLAGGALQGSRSLSAGQGLSVGRVLAGAGAGAAGGLIGAQEQDAEARRAYEKDFQQYKKDALNLEISLKRQAVEDAQVREQLIFENNTARWQDSVDEIKRNDWRVEPVGGGYYSIQDASGRAIFTPVLDVAAQRAMTEQILAQYNMQAAIAGGSLNTRMMGFDKSLTEMGIHPALVPYHEAASVVFHEGFDGATLRRFKNQVLEDNPDIRALMFEDPEFGQKQFDRLVYDALVTFYTENPDETVRLLQFVGSESVSKINAGTLFEE